MRKTVTLSRRKFLTATFAAAGAALGRTARSAERVAGANDTIRIGALGVGGRGRSLLNDLTGRTRAGEAVRVAAVCDIYEPYKQRAREMSGGDLYHEWERLVERDDIDAVVIATPDHWHAPMAIAAMQTGKDVYCEKPMTLNVAEAKAFRDAAVATGRIVQIGTQHTSEGQWHTAREIIREGKIGRLIWSQGSYSRNSKAGEWNYTIHDDAAPENLDWDRFLGSAPKRPFNRERFFRWRKYWDYSGGIATDLHYHKLAPLLVAVGPEFPERVSAAGGVYVHDDREVPDTFVMTAEYPGGHTVVLASSMANRQALPGVIRGHEATVFLEGANVRVVAEKEFEGEFAERFGAPQEMVAPSREMAPHMTNWLDCLRSREKCVCDEELGYRTMVAIGMSIEAYRRGCTLYWDAAREEYAPSPPRALHMHADEQA